MSWNVAYTHTYTYTPQNALNCLNICFMAILKTVISYEQLHIISDKIMPTHVSFKNFTKNSVTNTKSKHIAMWVSMHSY